MFEAEEVPGTQEWPTGMCNKHSSEIVVSLVTPSFTDVILSKSVYKFYRKNKHSVNCQDSSGLYKKLSAEERTNNDGYFFILKW